MKEQQDPEEPINYFSKMAPESSPSLSNTFCSKILNCTASETNFSLQQLFSNSDLLYIQTLKSETFVFSTNEFS